MELDAYAQNNEGGVTSKDYLNRLAEGSGNVDAQGNFSIEVLRAALKRKYGLDLPNVHQEGVAAYGDVTDMEGFICNKVSSVLYNDTCSYLLGVFFAVPSSLFPRLLSSYPNFPDPSSFVSELFASHPIGLPFAKLMADFGI